MQNLPTRGNAALNQKQKSLENKQDYSSALSYEQCKGGTTFLKCETVFPANMYRVWYLKHLKINNENEDILGYLQTFCRNHLLHA